MRELTFILPNATVLDCVPEPEMAHSYIQRALCRIFGGYSAHETFGGWLDDKGQMVFDRSIAYTVAAPWTRGQRNQIDKLIWEVGHGMLEQDAVYARLPNGKVRIVEQGESIWPWWQRIEL